MNDFLLYTQLGLRHITDINGYDHILFIVAFSAAYAYAEWRKLLVLITAFTIGHSLTLALSVLNIVAINANIIETLIPITILVTCISNVFISKSANERQYIVVLFFGLIHGLGFSNYLKAILGQSGNIILPLFSFNVGLELGQIIIIIIFFTIYTLIQKMFHVEHLRLMRVTSTLVALAAIYLVFQSCTQLFS